MLKNSFTLMLACVFVTLGLGCSSGLDPDYGKLGLVDVSGTVTLDGSPLSGVQVVFEESPFIYSSGVTDANGRYSLMFDSRKSGIVPGEKTVRIKPGAPQTENKGGEGDDPDLKSAKAVSAIPDCYNKNSILKVKVNQSDKSFDFQLKSDCSTKSES